MDGWLVFFALLGGYILLVSFLRSRQGKLPGGFELNGPFVMWRTQFGKRAIQKVARPARFWNVVADGGIVLTYAMGFLIFAFLAYLFVLQVQAFFETPERAAANAQSPEFLLGIPGVNPLIPVGYGLVAIILALVIHEGSHGVMAYASRMRVKSLGLLFFVVPVGAFVEPDEEDLERSTTREKNRVFAAGPTSNIVLAIVAGSILSLALLSNVAIANNGEGVAVALVEPGSAAERAGLREGDLVTAIEGQRVTNRTAYTEALNRTWAGQQITIEYLRDGQTLRTEAVLGNRADYLRQAAPDTDAQTLQEAEGKGFLGLVALGLSQLEALKHTLQHPLESPSAFLFYNLYPLFIFTQGIDVLAAPYHELFVIEGPLAALPPAAFFGLASLLYWIVWINVTLATFNALPMGPLDGGQMFRATLRERLMRRFKVDPAMVHVERAELGGLRLSGKDEDTQQKLDKIHGLVKRTTWSLGFGILGLILIPILVPHVLRLFY